MFTIRFIRPDQGYKSFSVANYEITRDQCSNVKVTMSRKPGGQDSFSEYVGADEDYDVAYVTNPDGRTIDVIRQSEEKQRAS